VLRFSGANDKGIDVAGFTDGKHLKGVWDNYQCKHFDKGITPGEAWPELGKILWYSFKGDYKAPRAYYFVAPKGTGTTLSQYLSNTALLKEQLKKAWDKKVKDAITSTEAIELTGDFAKHVESFDFSIFQPISVREVIDQHRATPYFLQRFGGGMPARPKPGTPPTAIQASESRYVAQLMEAYGEHKKLVFADPSTLPKGELSDHFNRQREQFYHAESLRVFVRDKVEHGTFESLQEEIFQGVVDISTSAHDDGYACVKAVTAAAQNLPLDAHPLGTAAFVQDKRGICHQLANDDRLKWKK
jgi:hypothetical protein